MSVAQMRGQRLTIQLSSRIFWGVAMLGADKQQKDPNLRSCAASFEPCFYIAQVQSFDQTFDKMNKALLVSCQKGLPVRVVRSYKV